MPTSVTKPDISPDPRPSTPDPRIAGWGSAGMVTGLLWTMAPLWYLLCEAITAAAFEGYSYAHFYISDLGVSEFGELQGRRLASRVPEVMNAGFIGAGLLFMLGLVALMPGLRPGAARIVLAVFGVGYATGIAFVGLVPGSPSNVANGLIIIHGAGAVAAIAGGNLAAISALWALKDTGVSAGMRRLGPVLGVAGLLSAALLTLHWGLPDGVWERGAVYTLMAWQLVTGIAFLGAARRRVRQNLG